MIVIAQCTEKKRDKPCKAKEMYMPSDLFKAQKRYWEAYADLAYILSGKYGLIHPSKEIKPYDQHISDHGERWNDQVSGQCKWIANKGEHVEIIAGKEEYGSRLEPWFDEYGVDYSHPFEGLGIGERTKEMIREARKVENKSLQNYVTG